MGCLGFTDSRLFRFLLLLLACVGAWAQQSSPAAPLPALPDAPVETVIATFTDGEKFTIGELKAILGALPPADQLVAMADLKTFISRWALMRVLTGMAEKAKLEQVSPYKEQLLYFRMSMLANAVISNEVNSKPPNLDEAVKYYEDHKEAYKEVRVKALVIAFGNTGAAQQKGLTEAQAKAKATKLLTEIRGGADFVRLVKENSDDKTSLAKDGDLEVIRADDASWSEDIKTAALSLKQGGVSEPIRQSSGFYILRAEQVGYRPMEQVRSEVFMQVGGDRIAKWMSELQNGAGKADFPRPDLFSQPAPNQAR
jgi:peptidyl-prolyl cis-trans isomerase C